MKPRMPSRHAPRKVPRIFFQVKKRRMPPLFCFGLARRALPCCALLTSARPIAPATPVVPPPDKSAVEANTASVNKYSSIKAFPDVTISTRCGGTGTGVPSIALDPPGRERVKCYHFARPATSVARHRKKRGPLCPTRHPRPAGTCRSGHRPRRRPRRRRSRDARAAGPRDRRAQHPGRRRPAADRARGLPRHRDHHRRRRSRLRRQQRRPACRWSSSASCCCSAPSSA